MVYQCTYHGVRVPKNRYRILTGAVQEQMDRDIRVLCEWRDVAVQELSVRADHAHLVVASIPPKQDCYVQPNIEAGSETVRERNTSRGSRQNNRDVELGERIGVVSTPTVIIDGFLLERFTPAGLRAFVLSKVK